MELLLLSNGKTTEHPGLLGWARDRVQTLLARNQVKRILLIPYAVIRSDWDARARELTESLGVDAISIHHFDDPVDAINRADAIFISGGNTWLLNQRLHEYGLVVPIQRAVRERSVPYVGWSAGCNVATPSIRTTNDMPVADPGGLDALALVPFQINPHYFNLVVPGFRGETRDQRLAEFTVLQPRMPVLGLPEGNWVRVSGDRMEMGGAHGARWFLGQEIVDVAPGALSVPASAAAI